MRCPLSQFVWGVEHFDASYHYQMELFILVVCAQFCLLWQPQIKSSPEKFLPATCISVKKGFSSSWWWLGASCLPLGQGEVKDDGEDSERELELIS